MLWFQNVVDYWSYVGELFLTSGLGLVEDRFTSGSSDMYHTFEAYSWIGKYDFVNRL